jgi:hypothetical protein
MKQQTEVLPGGTVSYTISVPVALSLRVEISLHRRVMSSLATQGNRGDVTASGLFREAMEALIEKEPPLTEDESTKLEAAAQQLARRQKKARTR